jgi:glycosyltransferase involved in cell wall biosynthesis
MAPPVLFVTRKYPPARGGMEEFSRQLYECYPGRKQLVALRRAQGWLPLFAVRAFAAAAREREAALIHLGDGLLAPAGPLLRRLSGGVPVVATLHGQEVTHNLPAYRQAIGTGLRRLDGLVSVSGYTARAVCERFGCSSTVIANGIDARRFACIERARHPAAERHALGLPCEGPLVVMVGRLVERKGAAWFVEHVVPLLDPAVQVVIGGDGPARGAVARAAAHHARVRLLGDVTDAVVERLYSCADLFVAPNIPVPGKPEGYGIAPAEAAAAGLPVLVADLEGLADMARETGIRTVPPGDAVAWAAAIRAALNDPAWARATRPPRTWAAVAADYARFFEAISGVRARTQAGRSGPAA